MRRFSFIAIVLCLILNSTALYAQDKKAIQKIEGKIEAINKTKGVSIKMLLDKEVDEMTEDGSGLTLTGYYKDTSLLKMHFYAPTFEGVWDCTYYYEDGELIYANEKEKTYLVDSVAQEIDFNHTTVKTDNKFYFSSGQLVDKTSNDKPMQSGMTDEQVTAGIHKYCDEYYRKLQQSDNKLLKTD